MLGGHKKRLHVDEVTDEQGRRRFHGAFTGGFSAGYFITVGSEVGWRPAAFSSNRCGGRCSRVLLISLCQ